MKSERELAQKSIAENRKAFHDYHIIETFEAGVALLGTEVKSIREGNVNLRDSYARIDGGEVWIYNVHIKAVQPSRLLGPRAHAEAQAAAAPAGDPETDRPDGRAGNDARADSDVLQERARQDRAGPGQGQAGARQARDDQEARGGSRDARRGERAAAVTAGRARPGADPW